MKRLLMIAVGVGSACGGNAPLSTLNADVYPVSNEPVVQIIADTNRNGTLDWGDPTEENDKTTWNATHGAIMLANIDDDQGACGSTTSQGKLLDDNTLAKCNDAADTVINGDADLLDLAPLAIRRSPFTADGVQGRLAIDAAAAGHVRLFIKRDNAYEYFNWQNEPLTTGLLRTGVTLAIEATDIVRDRAEWDGYVTVTFTVGQRSDSVKLRVAPVVTAHHLLREKEFYVTAMNSDPGSVATRRGLRAAINTAHGPNASQDMLKEINGEASFGGDYPLMDQWTQDFFEVASMSMPAVGGPHVINVYLRSANVYQESARNPLRSAGKVVFAKFRGPDAAGLQAFDVNHNPDADSLNSFGNTETIPPYTLGNETFPLGRLFRGSTATFFPDPVFAKMLESQSVQPPVYVDTSWLLVGHVDETISFVRANTPRGWVMLVNDPTLARQMLQNEVQAGRGSTRMFVGMNWIQDNGFETPAQVSIQEVLADTGVMGESSTTAAHVDSQVQILKQATGLTDAEIIRVPYLHESSQGQSLAYQPGTVNGLYVKDNLFASPDPHGPLVDGKDIFKTQLEMALSTVGVNVAWVEDWDLYHREAGEVHCGTNTLRDVGTAAWWASGR
ncbi:MAG: protein-arginine deiminase domain-containing protein [Myxococcaceae bacterium]|nr:protein-arginine deiminase domain-containing protein [Myxococcaceae bacterium]